MTGLTVVLTGPDGTGKSTLAGIIPDLVRAEFTTHVHRHWRPALLPSAGEVVRSTPGDPTRPHERPPHNKIVSAGLLIYDWLDFFLGGWVQLRPVAARGGFVLYERGWWDLLVDQRRYRLQVAPGLIRLLGRLLPRPDLVLILEADPGTLSARKSELPYHELARQLEAWRRVLPARVRRAYLDASRPIDEVAAHAKREILATLAEKNSSRFRAGWIELPSRRASRWVLPRSPRAATRSGLAVFQPVTPLGRAGWETARLLASTGCFRLFPKGSPPPQEVLDAMRPHMPPDSSIALAKSFRSRRQETRGTRYVAMSVSPSGDFAIVAKVGVGEPARSAINKEAQALSVFGPLLSSPLSAPRVLAHEDGILVLQAVRSSPRFRPWMLPIEVARSLGSFYRAGAEGNGGLGVAHGDCAPWNLLRSKDGWILVDWEDATSHATPFFDLFHYIVQGHALLGRPSEEAIDEGLQGKGWIGDILNAYAEGAKIPADGAPAMFAEYLNGEQCKEWLNSEARTARIRTRLLALAER